MFHVLQNTGFLVFTTLMTFLSLSWYEMYTKLGTETNELKKEKIESLKKIFTILNIVIYILFLFQSISENDLSSNYYW